MIICTRPLLTSGTHEPPASIREPEDVVYGRSPVRLERFGGWGPRRRSNICLLQGAHEATLLAEPRSFRAAAVAARPSRQPQLGNRTRKAASQAGSRQPAQPRRPSQPASSQPASQSVSPEQSCLRHVRAGAGGAGPDLRASACVRHCGTLAAEKTRRNSILRPYLSASSSSTFFCVILCRGRVLILL